MADTREIARQLAQGEERGKQAERWWARAMTAIILALVGLVVFTSAHWGWHPPSQTETIDPTSCTRAGEFSKAISARRSRPTARRSVRAIGQQYSFMPHCVLVPAAAGHVARHQRRRGARLSDRGHQHQLMLVPGYVSVLPTRFKEPAST